MRFVSILGDSISTYEGYNPEGYSVYYYGPWLYQNEMTSVYDTWWAKTNQALRAYLCINNSFSGSRVTGGQFPSASSRERTSALHKEPYSPDIILVYIGFNDFGGGVPVVDNTTKHLNQNDLDFFEDAKEKGDTIIYICLSSGLSGTFQSATLAKNMAEYIEIHSAFLTP